MTWNGYYALGGREFINVARTAKYVSALGLNFATVPDSASDVLPQMLSHAAYTTPAGDLAPWYDPDAPESGDFAGIIPLDGSGIESSSRSSEVFEFTYDGANPGRLREGSKSVTFSVVLVGKTDAAVDYGFRWLKRTLRKRVCPPIANPATYGGETLTYARSRPVQPTSAVTGGYPGR